MLYLDFALRDKQFEARYSQNFTQHYDFSPNFLSAELVAPDSAIAEGNQLATLLHRAIAQALVATQAKVLIIDNITYLSQETERSRHALPLMKHLKSLQRHYGLSILTLAHTPKQDLSKALTRNDLQGSKMLINFCDSAFSIGEGQQAPRIRYLKQIKARSTEVKYHSEQVGVCEVLKPSNFLHLSWLGYGAKRDHLHQLVESAKVTKMNQAHVLKESGSSNIEIAQELGVWEGTIRHWLKNSPKYL